MLDHHVVGRPTEYSPCANSEKTQHHMHFCLQLYSNHEEEKSLFAEPFKFYNWMHSASSIIVGIMD